MYRAGQPSARDSHRILHRIYLLMIACAMCMTVCSCSCALNEPPVDVRSVHPGTSELALRRSTGAFAFDPNGHFGDKVQYDSKMPDEYGGAYAIHCHSGHCYGIEVKYARSIPASNALSVLQRLTGSVSGKQTAHDDLDVRNHDRPQAVEYFYYQNKMRAELIYDSHQTARVCQLNIWTE